MQITVSSDSTLIAFNNLIEAYSKIYDLSVGKLADLEEKGLLNSEEYRKTIKKIRQLIQYNERRILEKLDVYDFDMAYGQIYSKLAEVCNGDIDKLEALQTRIEYFSSEKESIFEMREDFYDTLDDYLYENDLDEEEVTVYFDIDIYDTSTPVKIEFLQYLQNLDYNQFAASYVFNSIFRQTFEDIMDINNNLMLLDELGASEEDKDYKEFLNLLDIFIEEYNNQLRFINYSNDLGKLELKGMKDGNPSYDATKRALTTIMDNLNIQEQVSTFKEEFRKRAIKYKYYLSFIHPKLEQELILVNYNPSNLRFLSDKAEAEMNDISEETYTDELSMAWYSYANESFEEFFTLAADPTIDKYRLALAYEEVKYSILDQNTEYIADFYRQYFNNPDVQISSKAMEFVIRLNDDLINEMTSREDFDDDLLLDDSQFSEIKLVLGEEQLNNLFGILESIKDINNTLTLLWQYELYGLKNSDEYKAEIKNLSELCTKEREYKARLDIDFNNPDIAHMVINAINEYFNSVKQFNTNKVKIGGERNNEFLIHHAIYYIFGTKTYDNSIFKDDSVPHYIVKNYELECLKRYEKFVKENEDNHSYLVLKYGKILEDAYLTEEFAITEGDITKAIILSDDGISKLLEIESDEYKYDKENLIKDYAMSLISLFATIPYDFEPEEIELSSYVYSCVSLETAIDLLDKDSLEELKNYYQMYNSEKSSSLYKNLEKVLVK